MARNAEFKVSDCAKSIIKHRNNPRLGAGVRMAALVVEYPEVTAELISYQLTVIKAAQQYNGIQRRVYDTHFHINAAVTGLRQWSKPDTDLYTRFFTGRARAACCCSICDSTLHQAADCPRRPRKREGGKAPLSPSSLMFKKEEAVVKKIDK